MSVWLTGTQYYCEECGYVGPVVLELEKEETDSSAKKERENV